jgi:benzil reductase ((S)-benzoin forming)
MAVQLNKLAYITGSSKGIGKALSEQLIEGGYRVIGISRSCGLQHPNYKHIYLDLSHLSAVKSFEFEQSANEVVLINNAGLVGDIGPIGSLSNEAIEQVTIVNTLTPQVLCNNFIKRFKNDKGKRQILNISSGAAQKPIDAWATYCASKAALDLFSETIAEEMEWRQQTNWFIHSCAPGVVDTEMQEHIRSAKASDFRRLQNFKDLKTNNELASAVAAAQQLKLVIDFPQKFEKTVISVRDF